MTVQDAPASTEATRTARRGGIVAVAVLVALTVFGAVLRAHGFTSLDLWFDDAWAASPARVGWGSAVHMVLTAPGYGLALRLWLRLDPTTTWFGQLPAFGLSIVAIPATYALLRWFRSARAVSLLGALAVAAGPILVQYATRLKEYPFDLLAACVLLALGEAVRRQPTARRLGWLAVASVVSFLFSAGSAAVTAGVWLAVAIALVGDRRARGELAASLGATAAGLILVWAALLRHLPSILNFNWRRRGFLVDYRSFHGFERTVTMMLGGFLHGVLAYPVPPSFFGAAPGLHTPSAAAIGAVVLAVAVVVPVVGSIRSRSVDPALAPALALAIALVLAAADRVPFGDGRTDEALYPAFLLCLAALVPRVVALARRRITAPALRGAVASLVVVGLGAGGVAFGATHQAIYPTVSLRGLDQRLRPLLRPGELVLVDTFNAFGWCYYALSACRTVVGGTPTWPQGFRPESADPATYFLPTHYGNPEPELDEALKGRTEVWYVGYTYGTYDVGAGEGRWNFPVQSFMLGDLKKDGWRDALPGRTTFLGGVHCYAVLMVHPDTTAHRRAAPRA